MGEHRTNPNSLNKHQLEAAAKAIEERKAAKARENGDFFKEMDRQLQVEIADIDMVVHAHLEANGGVPMDDAKKGAALDHCLDFARRLSRYKLHKMAEALHHLKVELGLTDIKASAKWGAKRVGVDLDAAPAKDSPAPARQDSAVSPTETNGNAAE